MHLLRRLAPAGRRAILLSTHDLDLALRCADRLWLLPLGGPLQQGVPEDLVLTDAFAASFKDADVQFDKKSGALQRQCENRGCVVLHGEDILAMWTYRALERSGYQVVAPGEASVCIEVCSNGDAIVWNIEGMDMACCNTVEELLARLQLMETKGTGNAVGNLL
jgi:iron complex transport system ATP-binding protein